ncbi:MAG: serine protease, partial [Corynebacterium sp.]|nr:serine protease [Corynebacterium sp.]
MRTNHTVRLRASGRYASGLLVTQELIDATLALYSGHGSGDFQSQVAQRAGFILTAAHFLRGPAGDGKVQVRNSRFSGTAQGHVAIFGTDIAVLKLDGLAPTAQLPGIAPGQLSPGQHTITHGFGGRSTARVPKQLHGKVLFKVPFAVSR